MSNISDRGGAGPSAEVLADLHRQDLERHARGEPPPIDVGDVRELTSERIAELGEIYGNDRAMAEIAAAAAKQMANIKITTATLPSGQKLHRVGDDTHLSADDCDWLNSRMLQQAHARAVHYETSVAETILRWCTELCAHNLPRAREMLRQLGEGRIRQLMRVRKRERRKALARMLETLDGQDRSEA